MQQMLVMEFITGVFTMNDVAPFMNYGFGGVVVFLLVWYVKYEIPKYRQEMIDLNKSHADRLDELHGEHRVELNAQHKEHKQDLEAVHEAHRKEILDVGDRTRQAMEKSTDAVAKLADRIGVIEVTAKMPLGPIPLPPHQTGKRGQ